MAIKCSKGCGTELPESRRENGYHVCRGCTTIDTMVNAVTPKPTEAVNHPAHYTAGGIEAVDVIEAYGWGPGFCAGNVVKYILRSGRKAGEDAAKDIDKAIWYLERYRKGLSDGK